MVDVVHRVELSDSGFVCPDCGVELPSDIALMGDDVVDLAGASTHWLPRLAHDGVVKSCTKATGSKALVVCIYCDGSGCDECNNVGIVSSDGGTVSASAAEPIAGETIEVLPAKTDFEKMTARMSLQNFVNMREATRPNESS